jgi:hypothetical protein
MIFNIISIEIIFLAITLLVLVIFRDDFIGPSYANLYISYVCAVLGLGLAILLCPNKYAEIVNMTKRRRPGAAFTFISLLGSIVSGFFGRKIVVSGAQFITTLSVIMTTILAILAFFEVGLHNIPVTIELFRRIDSECFNIN